MNCDCNVIHNNDCIRQHPDPVYYKIGKDRNNPKKLIAVEMQSFDEDDYHKDFFVADVKFNTEEEAQRMINGIKIWLSEIMLGM